LLALDEPLGALDALTRIEMQRLVEQLWLSQGLTTILVTHDVAEAVALADRIVLIEAGGIAGDFPVDLKRPRQRGSADFAHIEAAIFERLLNVA
jgi:sulfonate transport system ATP-binding protein